VEGAFQQAKGLFGVTEPGGEVCTATAQTRAKGGSFSSARVAGDCVGVGTSDFSLPRTSRFPGGGTPSSLAFYGALYTLFDKYSGGTVVHKLGLAESDELTGRWRGYLVTSLTAMAKRANGDPYFQSWTQIGHLLATPRPYHAVARQ